MDGGPKGFYIISWLSLVLTGDNYTMFRFPFCFEQLIEWLLSDVQTFMISCNVTYIAKLRKFILQGSVSFCMPYSSQRKLSAGDEAQFIKAECPSDTFN